MKGFILLGVSGSIAAYKGVEIARLLQQEGYFVQAIMTEAAKKFVTPYLFSRICGQNTVEDLWSHSWHIPLSQKACALLVAPATANVIAKFASGICDDALSTIFLSFSGPKILAPCMNEAMYKNSILQENIERLRKKGVIFVGPKKGKLLCAPEAIGRLADPEEIVEACIKSVEGKKLWGKKVLVSAGPTFEMIDDIRYIGNLSSARMGVEIARIAHRLGADVTLVKGPSSYPSPPGVCTKDVLSAEQMEQVIMEEFPRCHIFLSAAAVSDYRPREKVCGKLCSGQTLLLELVPNTDILAKLGEKKEDRMLVGFCVEEKNLVHEAKRKMESKNLDMIVANKPESMGGEKAAAIIIKRDGSIQHLPTMSKLKVAEAIWEEVLSMLQSR